MITIISGTIRSNNISDVVANEYSKLLKIIGADHLVLNLQLLPDDFVFNNNVMGSRNAGFKNIVDKFIAPADKFVFIVPEYNGGFPGSLKAFIDGIQPIDFKDKKACLVGVSAGRMGNCRGLDQLTNVLNYLNMLVLPQKLTLPHIENTLDDTNQVFVDSEIIRNFEYHVKLAANF